MWNFKKTLLPLTALLAAACLHGMSEVQLSASTSGIPAAQGEVKTRPTRNDNVQVTVKVEHLAPPGRVETGATTYVVWARPQGTEVAQNLGALRIDEKLNGSLTTVLPFESFKVFITAEPTANIVEPSGQELLAANIVDSQ